jgi:methoxymalonate biosynthesis acyl carrier protein
VTTDQTMVPEALGTIEQDLLAMLSQRLKTPVVAGQDLFASGVVTSMFAMQLVVHLEQSYGVAIVGADLKLDNFRTVGAMAAVVRRLRGEGGDDDH